jgi:thymidylate synthase ThyX
VKGNSGVDLIDYTPDGDNRILAALVFKTSQRDYDTCLRVVKKMSKKKRIELFKKACAHLELFDVVLREFEYADLIYALVVSGGCFGQLKRHRMASITWSDYEPRLGITVPESVKVVGEEERFLELIQKVDELYYKIENVLPGIGSYILTNAHRRRVLMKVNLRELYHISRLREDPTAQWDIRDKAYQMSALARRALPITTLLLGGKSEYPKIYRRLYGCFPKVKQVLVP